MNKCAWFPELINYSMGSLYDEYSGNYVDNYFISRDDLEKCVMSEDVRELVDKNICECGGNLEIYKLREIGLGMTICKKCRNCGKIYLVEVKYDE